MGGGGGGGCGEKARSNPIASTTGQADLTQMALLQKTSLVSCHRVGSQKVCTTCYSRAYPFMTWIAKGIGIFATSPLNNTYGWNSSKI